MNVQNRHLNTCMCILFSLYLLHTSVTSLYKYVYVSILTVWFFQMV